MAFALILMGTGLTCGLPANDTRRECRPIFKLGLDFRIWPAECHDCSVGPKDLLGEFVCWCSQGGLHGGCGALAPPICEQNGQCDPSALKYGQIGHRSRSMAGKGFNDAVRICQPAPGLTGVLYDCRPVRKPRSVLDLEAEGAARPICPVQYRERRCVIRYHWRDEPTRWDSDTFL